MVFVKGSDLYPCERRRNRDAPALVGDFSVFRLRRNFLPTVAAFAFPFRDPDQLALLWEVRTDGSNLHQLLQGMAHSPR